MALQSNKIRIQNAIVDAVRDNSIGRFFKVAYGADGKQPQLDLSLPGDATPKTIIVNELNSQFSLERRNKRVCADNRDKWTFELNLAFDQEVNAEAFEEHLAVHPIKLASNQAAGLRSVVIHIARTTAIHPVQQSSAAGSVFKFAFTVELGRI